MENQRRDIRILTILLIVQYIFTTFTFPRLYRNELVLFNSNFNKMETQQLLVALTYLIFLVFWDTNNSEVISLKPSKRLVYQ